MICNGPIEELVEQMREGNLRVGLDHVIVQLSDGELVSLAVPVDVEQKDQSLLCLIRTTETHFLPEQLSTLLRQPRTGPVSVTSKDFLGIEARTAGGVAVKLEGISPIASLGETFAGSSGHSQIYTHNFNRIHFPPKGTDKLNTDELLDLLNKPSDPSAEGGIVQREPRKSETEDELFAIIPGVKLLIRPHAIDTKVTHPFRGELTSQKSDCFHGEASEGKFCLEDKNGDLLVYFRRPLAANESTGQSATQVFDGILTAIGYTHGIHPWPYYRQHRVDHKIVERWAKSPQECNTDGLLPMSEGRLRYGDDGCNLFIKAAEFFSACSERSLTFWRALWLMHACNPSGMAFPVRVLTLCSILEGLVKEHAGGNLGSEYGPWKKGIEKLGLDWEEWFAGVHGSWNAYRNKLAHGFDVLPSDEDATDILNAYSRLSAAIYILMARQMGFSGTMEASMLENLKTVSFR